MGIDPSLTCTGIAVITRTQGGGNEHQHIPGRVFLTASMIKVESLGQGPLAESARVQEIVQLACGSSGGALRVTIESIPPKPRMSAKYAERAHLYYALVAAYVARRIEVATLTASELKKLVTGDGGGKSEDSKQRVLDAVRAAWGERGWSDGPIGGRNDRADASALAWVSAAQEGWDVPPLPR